MNYLQFFCYSAEFSVWFFPLFLFFLFSTSSFRLTMGFILVRNSEFVASV
ncbi:hypothetical protein V6Z12_A01G088400 [Gossypium hirsutum]